MSAELVPGDPASCSQLGAVLRRESARLADRRRSLHRAVEELSGWTGETGERARGRIARQLSALGRCSEQLDDAGAAVQRYATELATARELGRQAQQRAAAAGLLVVEGRVVEPWGPSSADDAQSRLALLPSVQEQVSLAEQRAAAAQTELQRSAARLRGLLAALAGELRGIPAAEATAPSSGAGPPLR